MDKPIERESIERVEITWRGKTYHGSYDVDEFDVIVVTLLPSGKQSTTILGGHPAEPLAKIMLREMVEPYEERNLEK